MVGVICLVVFMAGAIPFQAGDPVSFDLFFDREELVEDLAASAFSLQKNVHQNFALVSPRRFGKTSVFVKLQSQLEKKGFAVVYFDCSEVFPNTLENLLNAYAERVLKAFSNASGLNFLPERIAQAVSGAPDAVSSLVSSLVSRFGIEVGNHFTAWIELKSSRKNEQKFFETTFDLAEILSKKTGVKCVVFLDEFQKLLDFGEPFLWALRARLQHHKNTVYFVAGSSVGTVNYLLSEKKSPLYNLFLLRDLAPFTVSQTRDFVKKRFATVKLEIADDALDKIISITNGIPFYVQLIGLNAYFIALHKKAKNISSPLVEEAYALSLKSLPQLEKDFGKLSSSEQQVIVAVAHSQPVKPSELSKRLGLKQPNAIRELNKLISFGYLTKKDHKYFFQDNVFSDWIKARHSPA